MKPAPFQLRPIIVSMNPDEWSNNELSLVQRVMAQAKSLSVALPVVVDYALVMKGKPRTLVTPSDGKRRFEHKWFFENITTPVLNIPGNFNMIVWHITDKMRLDAGVTEFNGGYWRDDNSYLECWVCADGDEMPPKSRTQTVYDPLRERRVTITDRVRILLHEGGHAVEHFSGRVEELAKRLGIPNTESLTHYFDYELKDIGRIYLESSFEKWSLLNYMSEILTQLVALLKIKVDMEKELEKPVPPIVTPKKPNIEAWAKAIQEFEGYVKPGERYSDGTVAPNGSLSYRNNNPGNLRWSPFQAGTRNNFSFFDTYEIGWKALIHQLTIAADGRSSAYHPNMTLLEFFEKYAPSSDNNFPATYAKFVAKQMGVGVDTVIKTLI